MCSPSRSAAGSPRRPSCVRRSFPPWCCLRSRPRSACRSSSPRVRSRSPAGGGGASGCRRSTAVRCGPTSERRPARSSSSRSRPGRAGSRPACVRSSSAGARNGPHEPVLLELPAGRAPPQGARLSVLGVLRAPRGPSNGFDEEAWLRRHGVHVVLHVDAWRRIGRRSGLGGVADRLHAWLARDGAPGLEGERRGVIEGVVLGEDQGLSDTLKQRFRASGPLPPARGERLERRADRVRRARPRVAARRRAAQGRGGGARRDRRVRARRRAAALRDSRGRGRRARRRSPG